MRASVFVLAIFITSVPTWVSAKPTSKLWVEHVGQEKAASAKGAQNAPRTRFVSPKGDQPADPADLPVEGPVVREESARFLGFSRSEAMAAVHVTVRESRGGRSSSYELVRVVSTSTDQVVDTFRQGGPSSSMEWQSARPAEAWNAMAGRSQLVSHRLFMDKSSIRMAIDPTDKVRAEANKMRILITAVPGGALGMTPVVRLYDGRNIWLTPMRVAAAPGRQLTAEVEAFHSPTGMHIVVIAHYTSTAGFSEKKTDVVRAFAMPGDPIGTTTIGAFNMTTASESIGERRFGELNPGFEDAFVQFGRD